MKRIITLLVAVMMLTAATAVFAIGSTDETESADIYAKYIGSGRTDVYSVDVVWGGMKFDYNAAAEEWDPVTHTWVASEGAKWVVQDGSSNMIEVTNHSSVAVNVNMATQNMMEGISGEFTNATFTLDIPSEGVNGATSGESEFMPTGSLASTYTTDTKIGEIVVAID